MESKSKLKKSIFSRLFLNDMFQLKYKKLHTLYGILNVPTAFLAAVSLLLYIPLIKSSSGTEIISSENVNIYTDCQSTGLNFIISLYKHGKEDIPDYINNIESGGVFKGKIEYISVEAEEIIEIDEIDENKIRKHLQTFFLYLSFVVNEKFKEENSSEFLQPLNKLFKELMEVETNPLKYLIKFFKKSNKKKSWNSSKYSNKFFKENNRSCIGLQSFIEVLEKCEKEKSWNALQPFIEAFEENKETESWKDLQFLIENLEENKKIESWIDLNYLIKVFKKTKETESWKDLQSLIENLEADVIFNRTSKGYSLCFLYCIYNNDVNKKILDKEKIKRLNIKNISVKVHLN